MHASVTDTELIQRKKTRGACSKSVIIQKKKKSDKSPECQVPKVAGIPTERSSTINHATMLLATKSLKRNIVVENIEPSGSDNKFTGT